MKKVILPFGKKAVYEVLAKEYLRQSGDPVTKENIEEIIQEFAKESLESYIPDPLLGQNPRSKIAPSIRKELSLELGPEGKIFSRFKNKADYDAAMKDILSAVTELTNAIMKHFYGLKISRSEKVDMNDPNTFTAFEQMPVTGSEQNKVGVRNRNDVALLNIMIRHSIASYILTSLIPWTSLSYKDVVGVWMKGGLDKLPAQNFRKAANLKRIMKQAATKYYMMFNGNLTDPTTGFVAKNIKIKNLLKPGWIFQAGKVPPKFR